MVEPTNNADTPENKPVNNAPNLFAEGGNAAKDGAIVPPPSAPIQEKAGAAKPGASGATGSVADKPADDVQGNTFTKMFGGEKKVVESKSIIDTIVSKTDEGKQGPAPKKTKPKKQNTHESFVAFSKSFLQFSIAFIFISAGFFYTQNIDEENRVLALVGIEKNRALLKLEAELELKELEKDKKALEEEIELFKSGYQNPHIQTIEKVVENRLSWNQLLNQIDEVVDSVYPQNILSEYVKFENYGFDGESRSVTVSGTLSDPLNKNLAKIIELSEAFETFPRDPNSPDDTTAPYFKNVQELRSLSKSFDAESNRFVSNIQFNFELPKKGSEEDEEQEENNDES